MKGKYGSLVVVALAVYIMTYIGMSSAGGYMPLTTGTNGIKSWIWAPAGIADDTGRFRRGIFPIFFPLFWVDCRFWHNDWTGLRGPHKTLRPPPWRLGLVEGSTKDKVMHRLEEAHALIVSNTAELVRAEYRTEDLSSPVQVELKFSEGQVTNVHYYFK